MIRVAILGATGAGKDTLVRLVSTRLTRHSPIRGKNCKVKVRDIQEFSVLWTDKTGGTEEFFEQFYIWYKQRGWDHDYDNRENDPLVFLMSADPAPLAYFYALHFADMRKKKHRLLLEDLYGKAIYELLEVFDVVIYLPLEFRVPEGDRLRKRSIRTAVDMAIKAFLVNHRIPFVEVRGNYEQRTAKAIRVLRVALRKRLIESGQLPKP